MPLGYQMYNHGSWISQHTTRLSLDLSKADPFCDYQNIIQNNFKNNNKQRVINMKIKAILFDSGRVLNHPRTGHWFIPPNFYEYMDKSLFEKQGPDVLQKVIEGCLQRLDEKAYVLTEQEEYELFVDFYSEFAERLPQLQLTRTAIECIAKDTVYNDEKFLFHDDVFEVIPRLSAAYNLGVVSDTWPSLERVFVNLNLRNYFSTFIISSILGVKKPNELMYTAALKELNVNPNEVIFVDDNIDNLEGAKKLGIHTVWLLRGSEEVINGDYKSIKDLIELERFIEKTFG